jgi:hypothetical protein
VILDPSSLRTTLDNINTKFLSGEVIKPAEGLGVARWIVSHAGEKGSYRGLPAATPADFEQGIRLFTGERLVAASARHIKGQEAARAACLLGHADSSVWLVYRQATKWMHENSDFLQNGTLYRGRCSSAFWRHF